MGVCTIETVDFLNFGKCLRLSNGVVEALVTLDLGPRIIRYGFLSRENMMLEDTARENGSTNESIEAVFGPGSRFYNYGGLRVWLSPEDMPLTYYPDNDPVAWEKQPDGSVEFTPPVQRVTDVQVRLRVALAADSTKLSVNTYVTNTGDSPLQKAVWCLTVLAPGGLEVVPHPMHETGLLANRVLSIWPYDDMSDPRVYWGKHYITLKQDPSIESPYKFGLNNLRGWAGYFLHDCLYVKRFAYNPDGCYPDFGTGFETYACGNFIEMESLGELTSITPGSTAHHGEEWELFDHVACPAAHDETTLDTITRTYIEK